MLWLLLLIFSGIGTLYSQSSNRIAIDNIEWGKSLLGHSFGEIPDQSLLSCIQECMVMTRCLSINYDNGMQLCYVNDVNNNIYDKVDSIHHVFVNVSSLEKNIAGKCAFIPCLRNEKCSFISGNCTPSGTHFQSDDDVVHAVDDYYLNSQEKELHKLALSPLNTADKDCGHPPAVDNASLSDGGYLVGDQRYYICNDGYRAIGETIITCDPYGIWSVINLECERYCDQQPIMLGASLSKGNATVYSVRRFTCLPGYRQHGELFIECLSNGTWTTPSGECLVDCENPVSFRTLALGTTYVTNVIGQGDTFQGTTRMYQCPRCLTAVGVAEITCQSNGSWSNPDFTCEVAMECIFSETCHQEVPGSVCNSGVCRCADNAEYRSCKCITDCKSIYRFLGGDVSNGIYKVSPDGFRTVDAFCDMEDGGWTVIQRRVADTGTNFTRTLKEYENTFGPLSGDHWIGLDNIRLLTSENSDLKFDAVTKESNTGYAIFHNFTLGEKHEFYKLVVSNDFEKFGVLNNMAKRAFVNKNGIGFSTYDQDKDQRNISCARVFGAFWHLSCCIICNVNGVGDILISQNGWDNSIEVTSSIWKVKRTD